MSALFYKIGALCQLRNRWKGASVSGVPGRPPSGFTSLPFSLQFFLFILIIFLAELSAAILAFIFRENVRTGPHALAPCYQPGVGGRHGQPVPSWGTHRDISL